MRAQRFPRRFTKLRSQPIKVALAIFATALVGVSAYTVTLIVSQQQIMRDMSRYNVTWLTSQAAYEFARLQTAVGTFSAGVPGMDQDEVQLRLDIVTNRAQLFESGEIRAFLSSRPELKTTARQLKDVLEVVQPLVDGLGKGSDPRHLLAILAPLTAPLTRLSANAHEHSETLIAADLRKLNTLYLIISGVLVVLFSLSLGLVLILIGHNRLLTLSRDKVQLLVDDLRSSGTALAGAVHEVQTQNTVLKERDYTLNLQHTRFDAALNNMSQALVMVDAEQRLIVSNIRYAALFDLDQTAVAPGTHMADVTAAIRSAGRYGTTMLHAIHVQQCALVANRQTGMFFKEDEDGRAVSVSHELMADGGWVATYEDVTERRLAEVKIQYLAHHDALTNLPNRRTFHVCLQEKLSKLRRQGDGLALHSIAVHCIDLDFFKHVNDTLGHPAGDVLLETVGRRLRACVREGDIVARLGGDEFAIIQYAASNEQAENLAARVLEAIGAPYDLGGRQAVVGASIGIALAQDNMLDAERLYSNADLALYRSKMDGRGTFSFFETGMEADQETRFALELELREALVRREFQVYYQPILTLEQDRVTGYEALLRWQHPERGMIPPDDFIPIAEQTGLITDIGEWVLQQACMDAANWLIPVKVAVNLSPVQFRSHDLVRTVCSALEASNLAPERLELEITESVPLQNDESVLTILHQIRALGVRTVLDDFGTGYSSLSYLRSFPFDKIKVDQSFVRDMSARPDCLAIVNFVAALARDLGTRTTAEGVETEEQLTLLRASGFTEVQGYLLGRPQPNDLIASRARSPVRELTMADLANS